MPETRWGRDALLLLLAVPTFVAVGVLARSGQWFPQQYAHQFFVAKGLVGLLAVVLLVWHMARTWPTTLSTGQRLRYLALLIGATATGSASTSQFNDDLPVTGANVAGFIFAVFVVVAMVASLLEDAQNR
jgi:hypothetical protein